MFESEIFESQPLENINFIDKNNKDEKLDKNNKDEKLDKNNEIVDDKCKKSIINSEGFGISNGVATILALLAGFHATKTTKLSAIGALLSLLLTDPINDSYSIYISMKHNDPDEAYKKFKGTFLSQVSVQAIFLVVLYLSKSVYQAFLISSVLGISLLIYDYNKRLKKKEEVFVELSKILGLILLTFIINTLFYRFYSKKL